MTSTARSSTSKEGAPAQAGAERPVRGESPDLGDRREVRELKLLYTLSRLLEQSLRLEEVVQPVLEALAEHMSLNHGTLTLLNRQTGDISIQVAHGVSPEQARRARYRLGEGVTGQVVLSGEPAILPKISESPIFLDRTGRGRRRRGLLPVRADQARQRDLRGAVGRPRLRPDHDLAGRRAAAVDRRLDDRAGGEDAARRAGGARAARRGERAAARRAARPLPPSNIIGNSHEMQEVYDQIARCRRAAPAC
jgi:Nif-specific regulatory protein